MSITKTSFLIVGFTIASGCNIGSRKEVWLVPQGYVGWLRLDYAVKGAPPLAIESGNYVVRFSSSGRVQTSSANHPRMARNEYFFEEPHGRHRIPVSDQSSYGVQNAYAFGYLGIGSDRRLPFWQSPRITLECAFVGSNMDWKADGRNCSEWRWGDSMPPKFPPRRKGK